MSQSQSGRNPLSLLRNRKVLSWTLYDWANSAFATTVLAGFFPLFFKNYWSSGSSVSESTARLGFTHALLGLALGLSSPLLGQLADHAHGKKKFLAGFTALGVLGTLALTFIPKGEWELAVFASSVATLGFVGAQNFYDALLISASEPEDFDQVSSLGYAMGYLGGGVLFSLNVFTVLKPDWFGFDPNDLVTPIRLAFASVAVWWTVFSIPILVSVHEVPLEPKSLERSVFHQSWIDLKRTATAIMKTRNVWMFLVGYFFYIDGINTIIKMAVDYGLSLGLPSNSLIVALLIVQFVGFPATFAVAALARRFGNRPLLVIGLSAYLVTTLLASQMQTAAHFYGLAAFIGLVQGGVQALSRSLFANLVPPAQAAGYFGFYNLIGRFSAVMGPLLIAVTAVFTKEPRYSIVSISLLFVVGLYFFIRASASTRDTF